MVRKISVLFFSLILIFCMNSSVFASDLTMTTEMAQGIIDYFKENINLFYNESLQTEANINRAKGYLNNLNAENFANSVNSNFLNVIKNNSRLTDTEFENITLIGILESSSFNIFFIISNCSYPNNMDLDFLNFKALSVNNRFQFSNYEIPNDFGIYKTNLKISSKLEWSQYPGFVNYGSSIYQPYVLNLPEFNDDNSIMYLSGVLSLGGVQEIYSNFNTSGDYYILGDTINGKLPIVPDVPSGDIPGSGDNGENGDTGGVTVTPSGDTGGTTTPDYSEKLDNIESGIDNVNQNLDNISGELNEVNNNLTTVPELSGEVLNSGDIVGALGFDFAEDPYSNFWLELTTGLGNAFTDEVRSINVQFRENTHKINLDDFSIQLPGVLKVFLTTTSTVFICWKMLKYWKIIIDNITSGNMDEVLSMNEEERYY